VPQAAVAHREATQNASFRCLRGISSNPRLKTTTMLNGAVCHAVVAPDAPVVLILNVFPMIEHVDMGIVEHEAVNCGVPVKPVAEI